MPIHIHRLYPSVPKNPKCVLRDDTLPDGTRVRAGDYVMYARSLLSLIACLDDISCASVAALLAVCFCLCDCECALGVGGSGGTPTQNTHLAHLRRPPYSNTQYMTMIS